MIHFQNVLIAESYIRIFKEMTIIISDTPPWICVSIVSIVKLYVSGSWEKKTTKKQKQKQVAHKYYAVNCHGNMISAKAVVFGPE